ncbi:c-type cytochrome [Roseobacter sp. EG26]|uniref:c-type cytochrome n=1 Tax=Roseobacter sp. EG26 TaxID=3412477 RepID=UPI003CE50B29
MIRISLFACLVLGSVAACGSLSKNRDLDGADLYLSNCAICHGLDARGGGGAGVAGLSKTPPDLTSLTARNGGEFPADDVLEALEGYATGGLRGRQMTPFDALQSDRRKRVRLASGRVRTARPVGDLLKYLEAIQTP